MKILVTKMMMMVDGLERMRGGGGRLHEVLLASNKTWYEEGLWPDRYHCMIGRAHRLELLLTKNHQSWYGGGSCRAGSDIHSREATDTSTVSDVCHQTKVYHLDSSLSENSFPQK